MKSSVRERLIRVIERRHDRRLNVNSASGAPFSTAPQSSHFEDLAVMVTKAMGVSEYLKSELSNEKGGEIQQELDQCAAAAEAIKNRIAKEAADFTTHLERWSA